jgi:hypothetical protein
MEYVEKTRSRAASSRTSARTKATSRPVIRSRRSKTCTWLFARLSMTTTSYPLPSKAAQV